MSTVLSVFGQISDPVLANGVEGEEEGGLAPGASFLPPSFVVFPTTTCRYTDEKSATFCRNARVSAEFACDDSRRSPRRLRSDSQA